MTRGVDGPLKRISYAIVWVVLGVGCAPRRGIQTKPVAPSFVRTVEVSSGLEDTFKVILVKEPGADSVFLRFAREKQAKDPGCQVIPSYPDLCLLQERQKERLFFRGSTGEKAIEGDIFFQKVRVGAIGPLAQWVPGQTDDSRSLILCSGTFDTICHLQLTDAEMAIFLKQKTQPAAVAATPADADQSARLAKQELDKIDPALEVPEVRDAIAWAQSSMDSLVKHTYLPPEWCGFSASIVESLHALLGGIQGKQLPLLQNGKKHLCQAMQDKPCASADYPAPCH